MSRKRKNNFTPGKHCPWCYDFDGQLFEIVPISKERKAKLEGTSYFEKLEFMCECPDCGCTFDKTKGKDE